MVDERLINETTSLCRACKNAVPARVVARPDGEVWMRKVCPAHGEQEVRLSNNAQWYERTRAIGFRSAERARALAAELFSALRRPGSAAEAAKAILWLALENTYINGRVVAVNGGL